MTWKSLRTNTFARSVFAKVWLSFPTAIAFFSMAARENAWFTGIALDNVGPGRFGIRIWRPKQDGKRPANNALDVTAENFIRWNRLTRSGRS